MQSWKLFRQIVIAQNAHYNPIFLRETSHLPVWYVKTWRYAVSPLLRFMFIAVIILLYVVSILYVNNLLFLFVPPLMLLLLTTCLTLGPLIPEERVKQSWELLGVLPDGMEAVLIGKTGGALWWMRRLMLGTSALLSIIAAGVGLLSLTLIPTSMARNNASMEFFLCGMVLIIPAISILLFAFDRAQHYMLVVTAILAASTSSPSVRVGLSNSLVAVFSVWLAEVLGVIGLFILQAGSIPLSRTSLLAFLTLGPMANFTLRMDLLSAVLNTMGVFLLREIAVFILWRWSVRQARAIYR